VPKWSAILIHHSATPDQVNPLPDAVAIRRFHTSYRQGGNIITKEEYLTKKEAGESGLEPCWSNIGYHWVVDRLSDGVPWVLMGRSMMHFGSHCPEAGMNRKSIGICVAGQYDDISPPEDMFEKTADFVAWLCRMYRIPLENVQAHRDYASYKTCPGKKFDMGYFRERVSEYLKVWLPDGSGTTRS
jgi:N-acetyl-anhydromuramyl-L-alanine amidase AmpD